MTADAQVPVLLLTGFLGAGKTTAVNHVLSAPHGRRLAVIVNDFGAINIDAELIDGVNDGVFSLRNGCICCSLQSDLMRTFKTILRRESPPDGILVEASGVSDPTEIVRNLLDPVIWQVAALDAVVALVDARQALDEPHIVTDALYRAQITAADFIALNKVDLLTDAEQPAARTRIASVAPRAHVFPCEHGRIPPEILFGVALHRALPSTPHRAAAAIPPPFDTMSWTSDTPVSLPRFQAVIGSLGPGLVRAKGILEFREQPGQPMVFQLAGRRATLGAAPPTRNNQGLGRLVLIMERGRMNAASVRNMLAECQAI